MPDRPKLVARAHWPVARREPGDGYVFDTSSGKRPLVGLFAGRRRLVVRHLVLGCGRKRRCAGCEALADALFVLRSESDHAELASTVVSEAPLSAISNYQRRVGIELDWLSSWGSAFNRDYHAAAGGGVSEPDRPGISGFYIDDAGRVVRAGSRYMPALDLLRPADELFVLAAADRDRP